MIYVSDLLDRKGRDVWSLPPGATVYEAIDQMAQKRIGALLVIEDERLVGIVSERDYARKVELQGKVPAETMVREIMSSPVTSIRPEQVVEQAMALMTDRRIRHLPVVVAERVVGIISIGDVVRGLIEQKESYIDGVAGTVAFPAAPR
jgi:CBS domain-containing protein